MSTFVQLHSDLEAAYTRTTAALNALAQQLEALPGTSAASKPAKAAKPSKPAKPKSAREVEPSVNGAGPGYVSGAAF